MTESLIYLDYNATTPIDPAVAEAMLPFLHQHFGNPSSSHAYGVTTRRAIETARGQLAALLGCRPEEILFTSGGSESNNTVIKGVAASSRERGRHIITSADRAPGGDRALPGPRGRGLRGHVPARGRARAASIPTTWRGPSGPTPSSSP